MKQLKITTQFQLVIGILVFVMVIASALSITVQRQASNRLKRVFAERVNSMQQLNAVAAYYAVDIIDAVNKANAGIMTVEQALASIDRAQSGVATNWSVYLEVQRTPEEKASADQVGVVLKPADMALVRLKALLQGKSGNIKGQLNEFDGPLYQLIDPITAKVSDLATLQVREAFNEYGAAQDRVVLSLWISVGILLLGILSGNFCGWRMMKSTNGVLQAATDRLAAGAAQSTLAAQEVASASQSLAMGASEQAASLEQTSASLEEISAMTQRNAASAGRSKSLSQTARESAVSGLDRVLELGRNLSSVKMAVGEMECAVKGMQSSSMEIAKIIKTIDEIAFQTNLLALNAAVEAARAGEAGLGFAVVADEVRSLAQRSAEAAKDTSERIESAVKRSEMGGAASSKVVSSLSDMQTIGAEIEETFKGIVSEIKSLDEAIGEIHVASQEQSQGINEVNIALVQMDRVTQTNAATAQQHASASEQLKSQVDSLEETIIQLRSVFTGAEAANNASLPKADRQSFPTNGSEERWDCDSPVGAITSNPRPVRRQSAADALADHFTARPEPGMEGVSASNSTPAARRKRSGGRDYGHDGMET